MLLHNHFIRIAKRYPSKLAVIDRGTDRRVTYSDALIASLILRRKFRAYDSGFIGIMLPNTAASMLAVMASLMAGKTPVMINYSTGAIQNAEYARHRCGFKTVITSRALLEKLGLEPIKGMVFMEDVRESITIAEKLRCALLSKMPFSVIRSRVHQGSPDENVVILFTSGSEKEPKAVQLTHRNIRANVEGINGIIDLSDRDSMLANLPFFHVFGYTTNLWLPLYHGMTVITYPNPLEYKTVSSIVKEEKPTLMLGTPSFFWGYLRKSDPGDFASVRIAIAGADKCPDALREGFFEKHGIVLYEGYGTTETSPVVSANVPGGNRPGSIGKLLPNVQVRIEDYETGDECPIGKTGKILVKGDSVMKGYLDDLEETSLRMRHGWYDTGDMGMMDSDGYLHHKGRLKRFVKIGGEMVSLVLVEDAISKHLPDGVECCVVEVPDAIKGARIIAALTHPVNEREIMRKISKELPAIALPKRFMVIEDFPYMGSGKINFRALTDIVIERI